MKYTLSLFLSLFLILTISCSDNQKTKSITIDEVIIKGNSCEELINELQLPSVEINKNRTQILRLAKTQPVILLREPIYNDTNDKRIIQMRKSLYKANPWTFLERNLDYFKAKPEVARQVLLKNGYFYSDVPYINEAISQVIGLHHLFNSDIVWIQRGEYIMQAKKRGHVYYFVDGPFANQEVTILIYDYISLEKPEFVDFIDLTTAQHQMGFTSANIIGASKDYVSADLMFNKKVKSLFKRQSAKLSFVCHSEAVEYTPLHPGIDNLKSSILLNTIDSLPFDEPRHEYGQQDGELRSRWLSAYKNNKLYYIFNHDTYPVFTPKGNAKPPEVCVDFITDSLDRASGSWFNKKGNPGRTSGVWDSAKIDMNLRNIDGFSKLVLENPELFETRKIGSHIEMGSAEFHQYVKTLDLKIGDIVFITGKVPWDPVEMHSHSFFIFEMDPITGEPILISGNAGPASIRPWKMETYRTPHRYIFMIIRIKDKLLNLFNNSEIKQPIPR